MKLKLQKKLSLIVLLTLAISTTTFAYGCKDCGEDQSCDCACSCCGPGYWKQEGTDSSLAGITNRSGDWEIASAIDYGRTGAIARINSYDNGCYASAWGIQKQDPYRTPNTTKSISSSATAHFNYSTSHRWEGSDPVCSRGFSQNDGWGYGEENVLIRSRILNGSSAEAHASGNGWAGSILLGTGFAHAMHPLDLTAEADGSKVTFVGNIYHEEKDRVRENSTYINGAYDPNTTETDDDIYQIVGRCGGAQYSYFSTEPYVNHCTSISYVESQSGSTSAWGEAESQCGGTYVEYSASSGMTRD